MQNIWRCPECDGSGATNDADMLPCWACFGGGEINLDELQKHALVDWLAAWREKRKGSRSPENNRANLKTRTREELQQSVRRILDNAA